MAYDRIACPRCDRTFGQESRFLDHLADEHAVSDAAAIYVELFHGGVVPTCQCSPTCRAALRWAGWKKGFTSRYARGHNARIDSVYLDPRRQKEFAAKRADGHASGRLTAWNAGLSSATDPRVASAAKRTSETLRAAHAAGSIPDWRDDFAKAERARERRLRTFAANRARGLNGAWNAGLTKETSPIIAAAALKISGRYRQREAGRRISTGVLNERLLRSAPGLELLSCPDEYTTRRVARLRFRCRACGTEQLKSLAMVEDCPTCFTCHPRESRGQLELFEFVRSLAPDAVLSDRQAIGPLELDVYVPSARLGIEYDGLYWHSELHRAPDAPTRKLEACEAVDARFMSVFSDEWRDRRPIVESMIRHRLGLNAGVRVGARSCDVVNLPSQDRRTFFEGSHLEGDARAAAAWGLADASGRVLAALSVRRPFHASNSAYAEVARFAVLPGTSVPGALGRLTQRALRWARDRGKLGLMTYVDRRTGAGAGYSAAGYELVRRTSPRFWWTDFEQRYNRFSIRADRAAGITQDQAADRAGVAKVWGCGNDVWRIAA